VRSVQSAKLHSPLKLFRNTADYPLMRESTLQNCMQTGRIRPGMAIKAFLLKLS